MSYAITSIPWKYVAALPTVSNDEIKRLADAFIEQYHAAGTVECWFATRAAIASNELDRIERAACEERNEQTHRSNAVWDLDREIEIEATAAKLKKNPSLISRVLKTSKHGAIWLMSRWNYLGRILDAGCQWNGAQRSMALDLLGVPIDERDGHTTVDPPPTTKYDCATERKIIVKLQIEMLQKAIDGPLSALDTMAKRTVHQGLGTNARLEALRKQAVAAERHVKWAIACLEKVRKNRLRLAEETIEAICDDTIEESDVDMETSQPSQIPAQPKARHQSRRDRRRDAKTHQSTQTHNAVRL